MPYSISFMIIHTQYFKAHLKDCTADVLGAGSLAVFLNGEPLGLAVAGGLQPPLRWAVDLQGRGAAARLGRGGRGTG